MKFGASFVTLLAVYDLAGYLSFLENCDDLKTIHNSGGDGTHVVMRVMCRGKDDNALCNKLKVLKYCIGDHSPADVI
ncbi:hypothetical protein MKZ38_008612 [Zalerion maritima]|uniref:Uncharacterized protein n=1 Tax=Zalerion maritima TaxID=339359 RepID=A0AAD5RYU3_9PEZI|nr:hypothetical protein MKZ38_008612 [Zalerion maritima]